MLRLVYSRIMADEQEITSDASAVAEGDRVEASCPIWMGYGEDSWRCGRNLHITPEGVDEEPVCLMHSKDPHKQSEPLMDAFYAECNRILEAAAEGEAHFERFVFPGIDLSKGTLEAICRFNEATFTQDADFSGATFTRDADFLGVTFIRNANFGGATFTRNANFGGVTFKQDAEFSGVTFAEHAQFRGATFTLHAGFNGATFTQVATFADVTFMQKADFSKASFMQKAWFWLATFMEHAIFVGATFRKDAVFVGAIFMDDANFIHAAFSLVAEFSFASFKARTRFLSTEFHGTAKWEYCRFLDRAEFRYMQFDPLPNGEPAAVFTRTSFSKPGEIVFDDVDLSRTLFYNCDVSQVWFTSSVRWGRRDNDSGLAVFDETIPLDQEFVRGLERDGQRDYQAVAQIYQQLKKSYDSRLDYWTANQFHFGEMEMKRLARPTAGSFLRLRQWLHRRLSLVALYRYASDYGNSYWKPLLWLLGTLLAAALLFPIPGLELKQPISGNAASSASVTYSRVWNRQDSWTNNFWTEAKLIGKSGITAIDTATFQRTPEYTPVYPRGRVLAIFETLLTSSLFALFLLAIRRQFRR